MYYKFALCEHPDSKDEIREFAKRMVTEKFGEEHVAEIEWAESVFVTTDECDW
jgi:hypothetical protein